MEANVTGLIELDPELSDAWEASDLLECADSVLDASAPLHTLHFRTLMLHADLEQLQHELQTEFQGLLTRLTSVRWYDL